MKNPHPRLLIIARTTRTVMNNNGWDILCSIPMQAKALSVTYTRCDDATMHAFLDAMNQRDWVFTLYAIKPFFPHYQICMCAVKLETCPTRAIIAAIVASCAVTLRAAMTYTRCDDATMHVFLDAMNRRDWAFTLHAIKPFLFFTLSEQYVCSQVRNMFFASDNCRDSCFACSNTAVWTKH